MTLSESEAMMRVVAVLSLLAGVLISLSAAAALFGPPPLASLYGVFGGFCLALVVAIIFDD